MAFFYKANRTFVRILILSQVFTKCNHFRTLFCSIPTIPFETEYAIIDAELKHLEQKYGLPHGRLYLAYCDDALAGCIGLRKIDEENCEMKRLYVRPEFRGQHIGNILVQKIIEDAKEIGYSHMLLDTLPFLESAIHMYKTFGFYEIESYNNSPMETSIYMKADLF